MDCVVADAVTFEPVSSLWQIPSPTYQAEYKASERYAHPRAVGFAFRLSAEISKQLFWIHLPGHCIERPHHCGAGTTPIG